MVRRKDGTTTRLLVREHETIAQLEEMILQAEVRTGNHGIRTRATIIPAYMRPQCIRTQTVADKPRCNHAFLLLGMHNTQQLNCHTHAIPVCMTPVRTGISPRQPGLPPITRRLPARGLRPECWQHKEQLPHLPPQPAAPASHAGQASWTGAGAAASAGKKAVCEPMTFQVIPAPMF